MKFGINTSSSLLKSKIALFFSLFVLLTALIQCKTEGNNTSDTTGSSREQAKNELPRDFLDFYDKFHADSAYQVDHITWPLRGIPRIKDQSIEDLENFHWKKENWELHQKPHFNNKDYVVKFDLSVPNIITEHIIMNKSNLRMMRRFARSNKGEWFLIFYTYLNEFNGGNNNNDTTGTAPNK